MQIKFKGQRIDTEDWVSGYYFKTPLTDENSGTDSKDGWFFLTGETRHCISDEDGVAYTVIPESVQVDMKSLDGYIPLEEYISTIYSRIKYGNNDDATNIDEIHTMIKNILK